MSLSDKKITETYAHMYTFFSFFNFCLTDTCCERSQSLGVYVISVTKRKSNGSKDVWEVLRGYNDFEHLHAKISEKVSEVKHTSLINKEDVERPVIEYLILDHLPNNWDEGLTSSPDTLTA